MKVNIFAFFINSLFILEHAMFVLVYLFFILEQLMKLLIQLNYLTNLVGTLLALMNSMVQRYYATTFYDHQVSQGFIVINIYIYCLVSKEYKS